MPTLKGGDNPFSYLAAQFSSGVRIGLTGPSGTGKTTFARLLERVAQSTTHVEGAREWLQEHKVAEYWNMSPEDVARFELHILSGFELDADSNVFDRTTIDALFFATHSNARLDLEDFERRAFAWVKRTIDVLVFFPYRSELFEDDGVRKNDPLYQLECAGFIVEKIVQHGMRSRLVVFMHHLSEEENIARINETIAASAIG